jgi:hypothetical protein
MNERCEGITASGEQCRCWAVQPINEVPYCRQHGEKESRSLGIDWSAPALDTPQRGDNRGDRIKESGRG